MNDIPSIWLWISGIFFLFGIIAFGAAVVVLLKVLQMAEELKPKIESLTDKVEALATKLDTVADRVEETMASVKTSVDGVGGKAQGILGSVETITKVLSHRFESIAPLAAAAMTAYKLFTKVKAYREGAKTEAVVKAVQALPAKAKR